MSDGTVDDLRDECSALFIRALSAEKLLARERACRKRLAKLCGDPWRVRNAAENTYCPWCETEKDRWRDQTDHHLGCTWVAALAESAKLDGEEKP